jgi:heme a synthase
MSSVTVSQTPSACASHPHRAIGVWLLCCCAMVVMMAIIGAITRLTESGLSIVEWQPLIGAIPPLSEAEWQRVFALYQQTPEFRYKNLGMEIDGFKSIFFWEWLHRLWGRAIGVVFAVPFLWFLLRRQLAGALLLRLLGLFALGGLQGFVGWWMVKSGLVDRPSVSHFRLATHLGLALSIHALMLALAVNLLRPRDQGRGIDESPALRRHSWTVLGLIATTIVWGAFVAGLDAGFAYNTFPDMEGHFLPPEAFSILPMWLNLFDNTALVQFIHRYLAIATVASVLWLWWSSRHRVLPNGVRQAANALAIAACVQLALGISALLLAVPVWLGALHQAGAIAVLSAAVWLVTELRPVRAVSAITKA